MFLEQLKNIKEKESFMKLAYWVATADGSLGLSEIKMLNMFEQELDLKEWTRSGDKPCVLEACSAFSDDLSRKISFSNLLAIGYSEEYENPCQSRVIENIREALAISSTDAQEYRDWMKIIKGSYFPRYYLD